MLRGVERTAVGDESRQSRGMAASDEILRLAVECLPDQAFLTLDRDGLITSWNSGAERLLGHGREHAIGVHVGAIFVANVRGAGVGMTDLEQAERQGVISKSRWLTHRDGRPTHAQTTLFALRTEGRLVGYAAVAHQLASPTTSDEPGVPPGGAVFSQSDDARRQLSESQALLAAEVADRTQAEASRIRLLRRLVVVQEEERRRIARDLHDDLGQRLTALRLMLEALVGGASDPPERSTTLANALQTLARIDQDLDFIAWELRPAALDEVGLVRVLDTYVEEWSRHAGIRAVFHSRPGNLERFAPEVEASIYRIAQEALNNVAKHAAADSVNVLLELRGENIALVVEDDGVGFHAVAVNETMMGLAGMRERAFAVGGTVEIEPTPDGGTTILACIPTSGARRDLLRSAPQGETSGGTPGVAERTSESSNTSGSALSAMRMRLQELQRAVGARDEFIATVAHELRNPIAPLTFQVRLALNKTEQMAAAGTSVSVEWIQSQLRGVEQRLHRLLETLDRLLDVSRLSTGRIDLQVEPMDLAMVVRDVINTLEAELAVARCTLTLSEHGETTGSWDRLRVEQICRNLLSNAIRFGAGRRIEVSVDGDDDFATVRVRDHGIGIAPDQQSKIFERFERGVEQRSGGFGIGLWIVRNICVALGGTVSVESELGEGACFIVMLPRRVGRPPLDTELE